MRGGAGRFTVLLRPLAGGWEWNEAFGLRFEFFNNPVVGHTRNASKFAVW